jgi:cytochrome c-type biogenesis protein CcmH
VLQSRYEHLTNELRCLVCQNQTIADSNASLAGDLRREVREMIARGDSDAQIKAFLTARYGDFVLYDPPLSARTLLLWAAPLLLVLLTVGVVVRTVLRRSRQPIEDDPSEESA